MAVNASILHIIRIKRYVKPVLILRTKFVYNCKEIVTWCYHKPHCYCTPCKASNPTDFREEGQSHGIAKPLRSPARPRLCPARPSQAQPGPARPSQAQPGPGFAQPGPGFAQPGPGFAQPGTARPSQAQALPSQAQALPSQVQALPRSMSLHVYHPLAEHKRHFTNE